MHCHTNAWPAVQVLLCLYPSFCELVCHGRKSNCTFCPSWIREPGRWTPFPYQGGWRRFWSMPSHLLHLIKRSHCGGNPHSFSESMQDIAFQVTKIVSATPYSGRHCLVIPVPSTSMALMSHRDPSLMNLLAGSFYATMGTTELSSSSNPDLIINSLHDSSSKVSEYH